MKKVKKVLAAILCLACAISGVACANSGGQTKAETKDSNSLTIAKASEPLIITPFTDTLLPNKNDMFILCSMYDTLIYLDSATGEFQPNVATEWNISEDGLTYTFKLREDVTFWDGSPLTAEDVAFGIQKASESSMAGVYYINFESVEAADPYTVVVHLSEPNASFLNTFCGLGCYLFSKTRFEEEGGWDGFTKNPLGSGCYQYVSNEAGTSLTLKAYDGYWGKKPSIENVTIRYIGDVNTQIIALESGEVDLLYDAPLTPLKKLDTGKGVAYSETTSYICAYLGLNTSTGPTVDENLRKAIVSAINYDAINTKVFEGASIRPDLVVPDTYTGVPDKGTYTLPYAYDVEAAKTYLAESSYAGEEIKIGAVAGSKDESVAKIIQGCLQEIGINAQLAATDLSTYSAANYACEYAVTVYGAMGPLYDATFMMQLVDRSIYSMPSQFEGYDELMKLGRDGLACTDQNERKSIYADMATIINEHAYLAPVYRDVTTLAYKNGLQGAEKVLPGFNYRLNDFSWSE